MCNQSIIRISQLCKYFFLAILIYVNISAETPQFKTGKLLSKEISNQSVGRLSPTFFDWDEDGLVDLLVGFQKYALFGGVHFYKNVGTKKEPKLSFIDCIKDTTGYGIWLTGG